MHRFAHALLTAAALAGAAEAAVAAAPEGWFMAGLDPTSYVMERDDKVYREGKSSARFESKGQPKGFGTMMQSLTPDEYRGKRVRFAGTVKTKDVESYAGLWMRVDGPERKMLAFDNMNDRPIRGTKHWTRYEVVLDVGQEAVGISFGLLMQGTGTVWLDEVAFEVVDNTVPVTGLATSTKPKNLNFER